MVSGSNGDPPDRCTLWMGYTFPGCREWFCEVPCFLVPASRAAPAYLSLWHHSSAVIAWTELSCDHHLVLCPPYFQLGDKQLPLWRHWWLAHNRQSIPEGLLGNRAVIVLLSPPSSGLQLYHNEGVSLAGVHTTAPLSWHWANFYSQCSHVFSRPCLSSSRDVVKLGESIPKFLYRIGGDLSIAHFAITFLGG